MPREKRQTYKGYRLISTYLRLQEEEEKNTVYEAVFNRRLKALHIFCVFIFSAFLIDGFLPLREHEAVVKGVRVLARETKTVGAGQNGEPLQVVVPTQIQINTSQGLMVTNNVTGYEETGAEVLMQKSFLFRTIEGIHFKAGHTNVYPFISFHGNFIFWPLLSLAISLVFLLTSRFYGSNTLSVIALLNLVPFFSTVYMI